jgi:hypothetical protein
VCSAACTAGDLAQLQWLHEHGTELAPAIAVQAAAAGRADMLKWMQTAGIPQSLKEEIFDAAAEHGQLQVCEYLHSVQCPWDAEVCEHAADSGHVLGFLMDNGCPYNVDELCAAAVCEDADSMYSTELLQLLHEQGLLSSTAQLTRLLRAAAASNSNLAAAQWLKQHGAEWPTKLVSANGKAWPGESLAWARAQGCTSPAV